MLQNIVYIVILLANPTTDRTTVRTRLLDLRLRIIARNTVRLGVIRDLRHFCYLHAGVRLRADLVISA
jgi:hypothetical protein